MDKDEKKIDKKNEDYYKQKIEEIKKIIHGICAYPVALSWEEKNKMKKKLVSIYKENDDVIKGAIISYINEKLSNFKSFKDFASMFLSSDKISNPEKVSMTILDYSSSFDGLYDLIDVLIEIDDNLSLKLLSFHLTRYISINNYISDMMVLKIIRALGESINVYAAHVLLNLSEIIDETMEFELLESLRKWEEKIDKIKVSKREKEYIKRKIKERLENTFFEHPNIYF
jgi:hypothetical protein